MKEREVASRFKAIREAIDAGDYLKAERKARTCVYLQPREPLWHYVLATTLLHQGRVKEGLYENEWRLEYFSHWPKQTGLPLWEGQRDASVFVSYEQGVADELQWMPILHDLRDGETPAVVEGDARIIPILKRTFGDAFQYSPAPKSADRSIVFAGHWITEDLECTHILPIGSLPFVYRKRMKDFEKFKPLIAKPPQSSNPQHWPRDFYNRQGHYNVGLSWRSRAKGREGLYTELRQWERLCSLPNVTVWCLQYDGEDLDILQAGVDIKQVSGLDTFDGLDDLGGFMSLLDMVVSPTNAVSKLAGALGLPVRMLLPAPDHNQFGSIDFPLLPSVKCHTKREDGWRQVIENITDEIERLSNEKHNG